LGKHPWSAQRQNPHGEPPRHSPQQGTGLDGKHFTSSSAFTRMDKPVDLGLNFRPVWGTFQHKGQSRGSKSKATWHTATSTRCFFQYTSRSQSSGIPLRSTGAAAELGRSWAAWCRIVFTWMFLLIEFLFLRSWGMPVGYLHTGKQCTQGEAK
jgi:hypothetical protein